MKKGNQSKFKMILLLNVVVVVLVMSCKKAETIPCHEIISLPPITHVGMNELGFFKNGEAWLVSGERNGRSTDPNEVRSHYDDTDSTFEIYGGMDRRCIEHDHIHDNFRIDLSDITGTGLFEIEDDLGNTCYLTDNGSHEDQIHYEAISGHVLITRFDTIEQIVSGTFEISLLAGNSEALEITYGRFDSYFYTY